MLAALTLALALPAIQTVALEADLNTQSGAYSSEVDDANGFANALVEFGGHWYFTGRTVATGEELFRTDGFGVELVVDARPGPLDGDVFGLGVANGRLWFQADDGVTGPELWTSDGTAAGTHRVADVWPGSAGSGPRGWVAVGGDVLFTADDGVHGRELWRTDGSAAGTQLVLDLQPGVGGGASGTLYGDGARAYLRANDGVHGLEPWVSDGTPAGTLLLADVRPGSEGSYVGGADGAFRAWNGVTYFGAAVTSVDTEPWVTDGTPAGTAQLMDLYPGLIGSSPHFGSAVEYAGQLHFRARGPGGAELYRTDGTVAGTQLVVDLNAFGHSNPYGLTVSGGLLYFFAVSDPTLGRELHVSDGTAAGTNLVADVAPGFVNGIPLTQSFMVPRAGGVLFVGEGPGTGRELWTSDGTPAGTALVADLEPGTSGSNPESPAAGPSSTLLFIARTTATGEELFVYDGTAIAQLPELQPGPVTASSNLEAPHAVGGERLLFAADDGVHGKELFTWDPVNGASLVRDIHPGAASSAPQQFQTGWLGGALRTVFVATDDVHGTELWTTDGTAAGTQLLMEFLPGNATFPFPIWLTYHPQHQRVYFAADDGVSGWELWATDGSPAGTVRVSDLAVNTTFYPRELTPVGDRLYFVADDPSAGRELFVTDGTLAGTQLVQDIAPGTANSSPAQLTALGDELAFFATHPTTGTELWRADAGGAQLVLDIAPGGASGAQFSNELVVHRGAVYFAGDEPIAGRELWRSDLTGASTQRVLDLAPGVTDASPQQLLSAGERLFFQAQDAPSGSGTGQELWVTDGTAAGTSLVVDLRPGIAGSSPVPLLAASDGIYFSAIDLDVGTELYHTDGTAAGTQLVADIAPGLDNGSPNGLVAFEDRVLLVATHPLFGRELFRIDEPGALSRDLGLGGSGAHLAVSPPVMGGTALIEGNGKPPGTVGFLAMSKPLATPNTLLTAPGQVAWLDAATVRLVLSLVGADFSTTVAVPASPALVGLRQNLQTWYLPGAFPALTSNGVTITLGL